VKHGVRCQLAEIATHGLLAAGVKPLTRPWVAMAQLFAPLLERNVPMVRDTRAESRARGCLLVLLFPLNLFACLLTAPVELLRLLRARRHRDAMMARLPSRHESQPAEHGSELADLVRGAEQVVCFDFRAEHEGRAALRHDGHDVIWMVGYRGHPPVAAPDATSLAEHLTPLTAAPPVIAHWTWQLRDPYELTERGERPW
jgi:hypothetical protein